MQPESPNEFENVFDAIEDSPADAANMKLRSALMIALTQHIRSAQMTPAQAAQHFGVTQPRLAELLRGKINRFDLEALVGMAAVAGLSVELRVMNTR